MDYFDLFPTPKVLAGERSSDGTYPSAARYRSVHFESAVLFTSKQGHQWLGAHLRPGPDLALLCRTASSFERMGPAAPAHRGLAGLTHTSCAPGDEALARALLCDEACDALARLSAVGFGIHVSDRLVAVLTFEGVNSPTFASVADPMSIAVHAMQRELERLRPPRRLRDLRLDAVLRDIAEAHGLTLHSHPLRVGGALQSDGFALAVFANPGRSPLARRRGPGCFLALRFAEPLGVGLRLRSAGWRDRLANALGGHDLLVGDASFDRAFRIEARDEDRARALLGAGARGLLGELAALGARLTLEDNGVDASFDLEVAPTALRRAVTLFASLREALRGDHGARGAYR